MKRVVLLLLWGSLIAGSTTYAEDPPSPRSERLVSLVLADHLNRYFCISKFPELRARIQRAYDQSRLKYIAVPCRKLQCSDAEQTEGMKRLFDRAQELSESESRKVCASYPENVKAIQRDYAEELDALITQQRKKK